MDEIKNINENEIITDRKTTDLSSVIDSLLEDARKERGTSENSISMPLAQLSTLGAGVASLIPAFNTVTQTMTVNSQGLYRLANASLGDTLKVAKDGNFWGAFKTADGGSKMLKLKEADPMSATNEMVMKANPATMMMAVALFSIEKELSSISEIANEILSFLEIEKEAEIEADIITLRGILQKYKHNWDNERYVASNHKMVCDLQRTARKNMISFQKKVSDALKSKKFLISDSKMESQLNDMQKKFTYYRLALYTFSLSSLTEIMLSGNFKAENITASIVEIRKNADEFRSLFTECSEYLEGLSKKSVKSKLLKGAGVTGKAVGKMIASIPKVKNGKADEFFIDKGDKMREGAKNYTKEITASFAEVSDQGIAGILRHLENMEKIYNHTTEICFDKKNLYLVAG